VEVIPYRGWERCARYAFGGLELILTLEVGPRVLRFGPIGGANELKEYTKHAGLTGGDEYRSYGGHRLWRAPEDSVLTMQADNDPVEIGRDGAYDTFSSAVDAFGIQKEMALRIQAGGDSAVEIRHRIYNRGSRSVSLAPWSITVMEPGGECLAPMPPRQTHSENLLPVRPLVLWGYTELEDARYTLGPGVLRLRQDPNRGNQKIGMPVPQGYAAHANHGNLFVKRFDWNAEASYPDIGCNFETFTREDMLEVESLGPLQEVAPGAFAEHFETWYLLLGQSPPRTQRKQRLG
jgi:hypothetical protein